MHGTMLQRSMMDVRAPMRVYRKGDVNFLLRINFIGSASTQGFGAFFFIYPIQMAIQGVMVTRRAKVAIIGIRPAQPAPLSKTTIRCRPPGDPTSLLSNELLYAVMRFYGLGLSACGIGNKNSGIQFCGAYPHNIIGSLCGGAIGQSGLR